MPRIFALFEIMQKRVFKPLGIRSATFHPDEEGMKHLALTYAFEENKPEG